ncbi:MAG: phosphoribosylformimino-5-aminoimidazole carboxamide ribotide isomerase [Lachnospiraceae bacterium]|nr:phosphoribosylformimino-5-aminoimidazole carboxamide ribotide isomerase [Lachnospiraceae bacterium]
MQFRPCIDIHNGKVKQIIGSSLKDEGNQAAENFVSERDAAFYADLYKKNHLKNGHIILLNSVDSEYYEATKKQAMLALKTYPGGMQVGGGITADNAAEFIKAGASHVIVTSYVFRQGQILWENLEKLIKAVGKEHIVLDVSCRKKGQKYYVATDRWQTLTDIEVSAELITKLSAFCDEFLVHAVDVEGKNNGIETDLVKLLAQTEADITYAGGVHDYDDLKLLKEMGNDKIHATIGSALDLFGGHMSFDEVCSFCK